jgi:integrase/recombinase XerD
MLKLMLYTAVRVSDMVSIRVSDVDLGDCKIFIDNGKDRYTLFPTDFRLALQTYIDEHTGNDFLFESQLNQPFTTRRVQQIIRGYADLPGINGLAHTTYFMTEQVRTVSIKRFYRRLGMIEQSALREIENRLCLVMNLFN